MSGSDVVWSESMPEEYDRGLGPVLFEPCARWTADRAASLVTAGQVLELAAGTGIVTRELCRRLDTEVRATDLNPAMVAYGAARVPEASWQVADALDLPFDDDSVDLVVCQFGVMFFPDRVRGYAEAARVLRPGAPFLFTAWAPLEGNDLTVALTQALEELFPDDPPTFVTRVPHGYTDVAQIESDVAAAGLTVRRSEPVELLGETPSAAALARGFCLGSPLRAGLAERGDLQQLTDEVARVMTRLLGDGPVQGRLRFHAVQAQA